jgi:hypothetical protein
MKTKIIFGISAILLMALLPFKIMAQTTKTWTGAVDDFWHDPGNWQPYGVPSSENDVVIPSGTPQVRVSFVKDAVANSITNDGSMWIKDSHIAVQSHFTNNSDIYVSNSNYQAKNTIQGTWGDDPNIYNYGHFICDDYTTGNLHLSGNKIINYGSIDGDNIEIKGKTFKNEHYGSVQSNGYNDTISISCEKVENNGEIKTENEKASSINISADTIINHNKITTGNGNYNTGNIQLNAKQISNTGGGIISTGDSDTNPELTGKVQINGTLNNKGTIRSGSSNKNKSKIKQIQYFNNVTIYSDTLLLSGDSVRIEADTLRFYFNFLKLENVTQYACIWGDMIVEFYGSSGAIADLSSSTNGAGIISIGSGCIRFYCDSIIPPPLGLDYICDLVPSISGCDTTLAELSVYDGFSLVRIGSSGSQKVAFQNKSTLPKAFHYSITDQKGWVQLTTGNTDTIGSFIFDSLSFNYTLPNIIDSVPDTVLISMSINGTIVTQTCKWIIYPFFELTLGMDEPYNRGRKMIHVFPNPFNEKLNIQAFDEVDLIMINAFGNPINIMHLSQYQIYIWNDGTILPAGIYLIEAKNIDGLKEVVPVIKQR